MENLHQFRALSLTGEEVSLERYAGHVVLVVNTASKCSFTPQLGGLETLYRRLQAQGLVILGFPCNQFGAQEPGDAAAIGSFCQRLYGVSFPMFDKIEVNGPNAHPLYRWLCGNLPGWFGGPVRWNFTKFLIDRKGQPVARFAPFTTPAALEKEVQRLLQDH